MRRGGTGGPGGRGHSLAGPGSRHRGAAAFTPDRRPFVSLADDLTDRDPAVFAEEEPLVDAQHRVNDLFQRALEVAGLFNLDANRDRGIQTNGPNPPQLPGFPRTDRTSMTAADLPYADLSTTAASSVPHARLPLTDLIQRAHAQLADLDTMVDKLREEADRIRYLVRPPMAASVSWQTRRIRRLPPVIAIRASCGTPSTTCACRHSCATQMRPHLSPDPQAI